MRYLILSFFMFTANLFGANGYFYNDQNNPVSIKWNTHTEGSDVVLDIKYTIAGRDGVNNLNMDIAGSSASILVSDWGDYDNYDPITTQPLINFMGDITFTPKQHYNSYFAIVFRDMTVGQLVDTIIPTVSITDTNYIGFDIYTTVAVPEPNPLTFAVFGVMGILFRRYRLT